MTSLFKNLFCFSPRKTAVGLTFFVLAASCCLPETAAAPQDAVKAGLVSRDLEEKEEPDTYRKEVPFIIPEEEGPEVKPMPGGDQKVFIKAVRFKGNTSIPDKKLQKVVKPWLQREHTLSELRDLAKIVQNDYRKRGYFLTRVYVPPQEIRDGVVELVISEGQLGKLIIRGQKRYKEAYLRSYFHGLDAGKTIRYGRLLRPMMLLNETPSLDVSAALVKGEAPGSTDVVLDVKEKLPVRVYFSYDNTGSDFVSKHRMGSTVELDSVLFQGDRSSFSVVGGSPVENLRYASAGYSMPLFSYGTRAEFGYSYSEFQSARELRDLQVEGQSQVFHTGLTQALVRSRSTNADAAVSFDYKQIRNYTLKTRTSDDQLRVLNFSLHLDHVDAWRGRTYLDQVLGIAIAGIMGATKDNDALASRAGSGSNYILYQADLKRVQQLIFDTFVVARLRTQFASDVLPSSEEMVIGGADTVRGFAQGEHLGDEGYILNLELRVPPPVIGRLEIPYLKQSFKETFQFAAFIDNGWVYRKAPSGSETRTSQITGCGLGLRVYLPHDISVSFDWGFPIGGNISSTRSTSEFYLKLNARFL